MAQVNPSFETFARIRVVGVGGSGCHAIERMMGSKIKGVDFVAVNTDAQDLHQSGAPTKVHIGKNLTRGLGAGMNPEIGRQAAEETKGELQDVLRDSDMVFVTGGLGGGTASGAAPIVAEIARDMGALTVGIVTKPFYFEGIKRAQIAEEAWHNIKDRVDALITIQNDKLLSVINRQTPLREAFLIVDEVLMHGVQSISDLITTPGMVNVDFADVEAIMSRSGSALMGIGRAIGEDRSAEAAKTAISSPLLDISIDGARGVLFNISSQPDDLTMAEVNEAAKIITENVDPEAHIIFGATEDSKLKKGEIKVTVIATGFSVDGFDSPVERQHKSSAETFFGAPATPKEAPEIKNEQKLEPKKEEEEKKEDFQIPAFIRSKMKR